MLSKNYQLKKSQFLKRNKLILVCENKTENESLTLQALECCPIPHETIVTHDGVEALDYLFGTSHPSPTETNIKTPAACAWETNQFVSQQNLNPLPQLIILDLQLPKMGGLEVLRKIRSCDRTQLIPVIILSPSREKEALLQSYNLGCNSCIHKAVNFIEFSRAIEQVGKYWLQFNKSLSL